MYTYIHFFIEMKSFRSHYGPGVDSASNKNEYQEYFLGVKAAGVFGWQPTTVLGRFHETLGIVTFWNPLSLSRSVMGLLLHIYALVFLPICEISVRYAPLLCVQWKTLVDGQRNSSKYIEIFPKTKFQKLVPLLGFIIRHYRAFG